MNIIAKRAVISVFSMILIFNSIMSANAASAWSISSIRSVGANVLATATKEGLKSAINIVPNTLRIARFGFSLRSPVSLLLFVADLNASKNNASGVKDIVLDEGLVKYTATGVTGAVTWSVFSKTGYATAQEGADYYCRSLGGALSLGQGTGDDSHRIRFMCNDNEREFWATSSSDGNVQDVPMSIPISDFSDQVVSAAARGDDAAQGFLQEVATESVMAGDFDADLMSGAVPVSDDSPVVPVSPPAATGDYEDSLVTGGDVGGQVSTALDRMESARKAANAALAASTAAADAARAASAAAVDVIGSSVEQSIKDAAQAKADAAADAADRARESADAANKAVQDAAQEVIDKARLGAAAAAGSIARYEAALAAAQAAGDSAAADAAAAALSSAQAVAAEMVAANTRALEAIKDAVASSSSSARDLPAFCKWASPVCDAVEWLTKPAPDIDTDTEVIVDDETVVADDTDINFGGSCPANFEVNSSIFGNPINIVLLDTSKFCGFLATYVKYPVYAVSSLFALYILGGRKDA